MKLLTTTILAFALIGCGGTPEHNKPQTNDSATLPSSFFTTERPANVQDLVAVKKTASKGDDVTFLARIGGRKNTSFVPTLAMMIVADPALRSCEVMSDGKCHCDTPEDYCCEDPDLYKAGLGTIRFMDENGEVFPFSVEGNSGLEVLKYVVVEGNVHDVNANGNFIVDAKKVWVGGKPYFGNMRAGSGE